MCLLLVVGMLDECTDNQVLLAELEEGRTNQLERNMIEICKSR